MQVKYKYLLNFSASYTGGGLKRLHEYAEWFHDNGGAWFIINPRCENLLKELPGNEYFIVHQPRYQRIFNDCGYLTSIGKEIGKPNLYYSYGIPIYYSFGKVNWFHLSNVLPLHSRGISLSLFDRYIRMKALSWKIKNNFKNANIISAESNNSLSFIDVKDTQKLFLSVNGSDDEIKYLQKRVKLKKDDIATAVGTQNYKALMDTYQIFKDLKNKVKELTLVIIGNEKTIPKILMKNKSVIATGVINQKDVIKYLKKTKYYISTTRIENSYNAASEGVIFAGESFISDIGPHRELFQNEKINYATISNLKRPVIHVKSEDLTGENLKSWGEIITDMISMVNSKL